MIILLRITKILSLQLVCLSAVRLLLAEHPALCKAAWDMRSADEAMQRVMSVYCTEQPSALPHYLLWINGAAWPWVPVYLLWHHSQLTLVHLAASLHLHFPSPAPHVI
jgi:hypothetical protein